MTSKLLTITQIIAAGHYKSRRRIMELLKQGKIKGTSQYGIWLVEVDSLLAHKRTARNLKSERMKHLKSEHRRFLAIGHKFQQQNPVDCP